jgi:CBS domain-containing protein
MASKVREIMTGHPVTLEADSTVLDAARRMESDDIGSVIVEENGNICGIVTDRDIVVRAIAASKDPAKTALRDICTKELLTLSPDDDLDRAVALMREKAVRRVPVIDAGGDAIGILSLGDLAMERDRESVLGQISAAPPTH